MNCRDFIKCLCLMLWIATSAVSQEIGIAPEGQGDRYTVKDEEFSVRLPLHPSMTTTRVPRKTDGKLRLQRRLRTASGGLYFGIDAFENPKPKQSLEEFIAEVGLTGEYEYDPRAIRKMRERTRYRASLFSKRFLRRLDTWKTFALCRVCLMD
jgi:hypothetical protein